MSYFSTADLHPKFWYKFKCVFLILFYLSFFNTFFFLKWGFKLTYVSYSSLFSSSLPACFLMTWYFLDQPFPRLLIYLFISMSAYLSLPLWHLLLKTFLTVLLISHEFGGWDRIWKTVKFLFKRLQGALNYCSLSSIITKLGCGTCLALGYGEVRARCQRRNVRGNMGKIYKKIDFSSDIYWTTYLFFPALLFVLEQKAREASGCFREILVNFFFLLYERTWKSVLSKMMWRKVCSPVFNWSVKASWLDYFDTFGFLHVADPNRHCLKNWSSTEHKMS